jgi:hypothetical protein
MIHEIRLFWCHLLGVGFLGLIATSSSYAASTEKPSTNLRVELNPQVGTGTMSSGAKVRHATGYGLALTKPLQNPWLASKGLALSPKIEISSLVVSAQEASPNLKRVSTYDHRIISGGLILSRNVLVHTQPWDGIYASASYGRGFSKLTLDESAPRTFKQSSFSGISGTQWSGELGTWIPLKVDFGLSVALVGSTYKADQTKATGTFEGEELAADDSLYLVSGSRNGTAAGLDPQVSMTTYAAKVGVVLDF